MWLKIFVVVCAVALSSALGPKKFKNLELELENLENLDGDELIAPFTDPFDGIDYRLPNDTIPLRYDIMLSTDIHRGMFNFTGQVTIHIQAAVNTPNITVHQRQLTIESVRLLDGTGVQIQNNVAFTERPDVEFVVIQPFMGLTAGNFYQVEIKYRGELRNDDAGFYRSSYVNDFGTTVWLATTQFESTDARHAFPCYDEPGMRSRFSIQIRHDASYTAVSNTAVESRTPESNTNYVVTKFFEVPSVQTYLIAFLVSDFKFIQNSNGNTPHRIYARPASIFRGDAQMALDASVMILPKYEQYLGVAYTLEKMDQAAIPDFAAGAMENWGLVTYRESSLLWNEQTSLTSSKYGIRSTVSHEFAHQWFGDLVSPAWWSYLWLNEGFASYYASFLNSLTFPEDRWIDTHLINTVQPVFETDSNPNIRAMTYYVESPQRIDALFDNVAYAKSGSVLKMFQHSFGEPTWAKGLHFYLQARGFNSAVPDDLFRNVQVAVNQDNPMLLLDVMAAMRSWELQSGFPYLNVSRVGTTLNIEQNRFMYSNRNSPNLWWVPVSYVVGSNPDFSSTKADFWMPNARSMSLPSNLAPKPFTANDWIIVNTQQALYYRVNYDNTLWNQLITQLNRPGNEFMNIHLYNRAQLIDDAHNFARAELLDYDILFGIMNYLEKETDYVPWVSANRANTLLNRWTTGSSLHPRYQAFMQKNVISFYNRLGTMNVVNENRVERLARPIAIDIACTAQLPACLTQTTQRITEMLSSGNAIHQDLTTTIYCNGMRSASVATFNAMQNKLLQSSVQADRNAIISGMGCTQNQQLLSSFFAFAINSQSALSTAERQRILVSPINIGVASINTMIEFLQQNYAAISTYNYVPTMSSNIAARISNQAQLTSFITLLNLLQTNSFLTAAQVNTYTTSANTIVSWQGANLGVLEGFFNSLQETTTTTLSPTPTTPGATTPTTPSADSTTEGAGSIALSAAILMFSVVIKLMM